MKGTRNAVRRRCAAAAAAALCLLLSPGHCAGDDGAAERIVYSSRPDAGRRIALTFDDGPHPVYTPLILDILAEYGIRATFFLVGENAVQYPETVLRIQREGHEIGNHTYDHEYLHKKSMDAVMQEIVRAEDAVLAICDQRPKLLRPPGGLYDAAVCDAARAADYEVILWSIDTLDWAHTPSETIAETVRNEVTTGDIILCHDYIGGKPSPTPAALRIFIPELLARGYEFVTVSELLCTECCDESR